MCKQSSASSTIPRPCLSPLPGKSPGLYWRDFSASPAPADTLTELMAAEFSKTVNAFLSDREAQKLSQRSPA